MYFFTLAVYLVGIGIIYRAVHSPFGQVLRAVRENESRAIALGYDTQQCKLLAFVLSGALSGVAGAAQKLTFPFPALTAVSWPTQGPLLLRALPRGPATP